MNAIPHMYGSTGLSHDAGPIVEEGTRSLQYLRAMLDRLNVGVALLDEDGNVVSVNGVLGQILRDGDRLLIRRERIYARAGSDNMRLQAAIAACAPRASGEPMSSTVAVSGSGSEHSLIVTVCPVGQADPVADAGLPVMLYVIDTAPSAGLDERFLKSAFELTDAECLIARRLLAGDTLADIADARGTTVHTVRSQLKSIMLKMGVSRQSDLVKLLARCDTFLRDGQPSTQGLPRRFDAGECGRRAAAR